MVSAGRLTVVGLGPGALDQITPEAAAALHAADDVVGYLPLGNYCVVKQSTRKYNGYDWVIFRYQGTEYWTAVIGDRNRVEDCNCDCN